MLQAVKINRKLHSVGEVSPVLVGLNQLWKKPNSVAVSGVPLLVLLLFTHVNLRGSQFYGRHFYSDLGTPLARCHTLWPGGTNEVSDYSSYDNTKSLEFCLGPFNQIA